MPWGHCDMLLEVLPVLVELVKVVAVLLLVGLPVMTQLLRLQQLAGLRAWTAQEAEACRCNSCVPTYHCCCCLWTTCLPALHIAEGVHCIAASERAADTAFHPAGCGHTAVCRIP